MTIAIPSQWPKEVGDLYLPVRTLGKGGFASVVLARPREAPPTASASTTAADAQPSQNSCQNPAPLVAIKVVGGTRVTRQEIGYAHREVDILRELEHPHIMRVLRYWEAPRDREGACVMALSYAPGPTVEALLRQGGALSLVFSRTILAQLVDALSYLHSRAVLHRDVKPDNVVVTGARPREQPEIWDDGILDDQTITDWTPLRQKWHVTLVDFGFARALGPGDMKKTKAEMAIPPSAKQRPERDADTSHHSFSRAFQRQLSALGNRGFAAPEILSGVHVEDLARSSVHSSVHSSTAIDITKNLSPHVSPYGLLADAYSLGAMMTYVLTGVPPGRDVQKTIAAHHHPCAVLARWLCGTKKKVEDARTVSYRPLSKIPPETLEIMRGFLRPDSEKRTSIHSVSTGRLVHKDPIPASGSTPHMFGMPQVRNTPWVVQVMGENKDDDGKIHYLSIVSAGGGKNNDGRTNKEKSSWFG